MGREAVEATEQLEMRNSGGLAVAAMEMAKAPSGGGEGVLELRALPSAAHAEGEGAPSLDGKAAQ